MISLQAEFYPVMTAYADKPCSVRFFRKNEPPNLQDAKDWEILVDKDREFKTRAFLTFAGPRYTQKHIDKIMQMLRQHEAQKGRDPYATLIPHTQPVVYAAPSQNAISIRNDHRALTECFDIVSCAIGHYKPLAAAERHTHTLGQRPAYKGAALSRIMQKLNLSVIENDAPTPASPTYESWQPD